MKDHFLIGYGCADITPEESVPLGGYGNTSFRFFQSIRDRLRASCLALTDGANNTVILLELDALVIDEPFLSAVRKQIHSSLGIAEDCVMISASHSHSAPDIWNRTEPSILRYHALLEEQLAAAARQAMADRVPTQLFYGSISVPGMNFVKHYYNVEDGEKKFFGDNFGTPVYDETTDHATKANDNMHVLQFVREGKPEIVLINWRAHPHFTGGAKKYELSADYIGSYRKALEAMRPCKAIFFQGCAGNLNSSTRLKKERQYTTCDSYGMNLAAKAVECLEKQMEPASAGEIKVKNRWLEAPLDHRTDHILEQAKQVQKLWNETYDLEAAVEMGRSWGIRSPYHANAIVAKASKPASMEMEINAIAIGPDVAIVTGTEMFDTISTATEEDSPFAMTVTMGYCNAYRGYLPSLYGFEYTCYESDVSWFAPGTAELVVKTYLQMLKELKQ